MLWKGKYEMACGMVNMKNNKLKYDWLAVMAINVNIEKYYMINEKQ